MQHPTNIHTTTARDELLDIVYATQFGTAECVAARAAIAAFDIANPEILAAWHAKQVRHVGAADVTPQQDRLTCAEAIASVRGMQRRALNALALNGADVDAATTVFMCAKRLQEMGAP